MLTAVILSTIAILLAIVATLLLVSFARELSALRGQIEVYQNRETRHFKDVSTRIERLERLDDAKHKRIGRLEESLKHKAEARKPKAKTSSEEQAETTK